MENDLPIHSAKCQIILSDGTVYLYGSDSTVSSHSTIQCACIFMALTERMTTWPWEYVYVSIPTGMSYTDPDCVLDATIK